jgi:hypothetical protein
MSLLQFYIPFEVAQATIHELGETGLVHFRDVWKFNCQSIYD